MTDNEIADVLVEAGIGRRDAAYPSTLFIVPGPQSYGALASEFLSDWRVAGACLERIQYLPKDWRSPRAICEAFAKAWRESNDQRGPRQIGGEDVYQYRWGGRVSMTDTDRIRLAEAMGWVWENAGGFSDSPRWVRPDGSIASPVNTEKHKAAPGAFNPPTNANDDYAVLEWMRTNKDLYHNDRLQYFLGKSVIKYQIGDYARAALAVIGNGDE